MASQNSTNLIVGTNHYIFKVVTRIDPSSHLITLTVGNKARPCLLVNIITPSTSTDDERMKDFYDKNSETAALSNIEALDECVYGDVTQNYFNKHSLGLELLQTCVHFLKHKYSFIKKVRLYDKSYIPCNRDFLDTLDLLTYSIALYGATWYEKVLYAYIDDPKDYEEYRNQIRTYTSSETKSLMSFDDIIQLILSNGNEYAISKLHENMEKWEDMFSSTTTLPLFFQTISKDIPKSDKCKFFKGWLEMFISSKVRIHRGWVFDVSDKVYPKKLTHRATRRQTRHQSRRQTRRKPRHLIQENLQIDPVMII